MNDIFISYSSKDRDWVKTLALALEAEGYDVWWDPEILPGQDFEKVIKDALNQSHCVLTVWSENSIQSHWVRGETSRGLARNIYVPVLYQQVEVPMQFGHIQSANLIDWQGKTTDPRYQKLLRAINLKVKPSQKAKSELESESLNIQDDISKPKPKQRYVLWLIILAVLMGGGYFAYNAYEKPIVETFTKLFVEKKEKKQKELVATKPKVKANTAQGNPQADFSLGLKYQYGQNGVPQDYQKAAEYYQKAADQGYAKAQTNLGVLYRQGKGVKQDLKKAVELYKKAADQGHANAQNKLGLFYEQGKGVKQDYKKAAALYKKAADQGNAFAQYRLGLFYAKRGQDVAQDKKKATEYYQKSAEYYQKAVDQGQAAAQTNLGMLYGDGKGVKQDDKKAAELYKKAADQGDAYGQNNLAVLYKKGKGVKQDYKKAAGLYQKAADQGHANAQYHLGVLYEEGNGVKQDYKKAAELYQKAVDQGHARAQTNLGSLYEQGKGVKQDDKKATELYQKAVDQGNGTALYNLKRLEKVGKAKAAKQKLLGQFIDNEDGTITDTKTKLMWKKCSEGLSGEQCEQGKAKEYTLDKAMALAKKAQFAAYSDWRLPTKDELHSLVYCSNGIAQSEAWKYSCDGKGDKGGEYQRPTINQIAFPKTKLGWYWSSSPSANDVGYAWVVYFDGGDDDAGYKNYGNRVRLVRSGQ